MVDAADALNEGEPECKGEAGRMEERQNAGDAVVGIEGNDSVTRIDVRHDVGVREQDAFGLSAGAARVGSL